MVQLHELAALIAHLGAPHLEQMTVRTGGPSQLLVHWGCGCTAMGTPALEDERTSVRWSRCEHHAGAEAVVPG